MTLTQGQEVGMAILSDMQETHERWIADATNLVMSVQLPSPFSGEDVKIALLNNGLRKPRHHKVWGAFIMSLIRANRLERAPTTGHTKTRISHGRRTQLYVRLLPLAPILPPPSLNGGDKYELLPMS